MISQLGEIVKLKQQIKISTLEFNQKDKLFNEILTQMRETL